MSGKFFDYGTGSKPKFKRKARARAKRPRDRKAAARKAAETRRRKKFNQGFDYGVGKTVDQGLDHFKSLLNKAVPIKVPKWL